MTDLTYAALAGQSFGAVRDIDGYYEKEDVKGPGLAEQIETHRFLGREFLVWLWFASETSEQTFHVEGIGDIALWLESLLALDKLTDTGRDKVTLAGYAPADSAEAKEAIRQGKLPARVKIAVRIEDEREFHAVIEAEDLALSGVKIPALLKGEGDDPFFERMQLLEQLEQIVETLYRRFLRMRISADWNAVVVPALAAWASGEESSAIDRYLRTAS